MPVPGHLIDKAVMKKNNIEMLMTAEKGNCVDQDQ